jgi:NAD(P)-dependent dehydrogenase (short-subunit alcohol dehydrogenase family)
MTVDAWVIGGTSGIGLATAHLLVESGLSVYATGPEECDVRDDKEVEEAYTQLACPTYVVYSAGINTLMWNKEQDLDIVDDMFNVNVFGFMRVVKTMANHWRTPFPRSLVAVTSDAARRPMRTSMAYCASKAALDMCIKQAAREHAPIEFGPGGAIRVNGVAPGMTAPTGMSEYIDEAVPAIRGWTLAKAKEYEASQNPMHRRISPAEIAAAVKYMLVDSPMSQTGSIMEVNCGR